LNTQDHLVLRLARLKSSEEVEQKGESLTFLFSKGGVGKYASRLATHRVLPGDILVFNGAAGSKLSVFDNKGEFLFWAFSLCFENLLPLFSGEEISLLHQIVEGFKAGKVYPASIPMTAECQRLLEVVPPQFNLNHRGQLIRIASTILSVEFNEGLSKRRGSFRSDDHMVQIFEKLSASELISLSVCELADRFSCSRRHLNRLFHQHFGVSVAALRMEMRLLKAISLLRDADAKVINVAEQCGFNHLGLFNTCFKRRFGSSPGQWRKSSFRAAGASASNLENKSICPLQFSGLCPLNGRQESPSPAVLRSCAEKVLTEENSANSAKDSEHRDLIFGAHPLQQTPSAVGQKRGGMGT
jgi:AraC-like DNA-binding protein